ncbi:MAG: radical SAM (seleno)protein TrsS [Peptococcales bacterium]
MMSKDIYLSGTESLCPECLKVIPAYKIISDDKVYLVKKCINHGEFRTLIWDEEATYESWGTEKIPVIMENCVTTVEKGCPFDCGLCPEHRQSTCCVLLEVTGDCNLNCPICFASSEEKTGYNPPLVEIKDWYNWLLAHGGPYNIQLSGGEPTLRDDLPEIVKMGHQLGFSYIQLNTNGMRLAKEPDFVEKLKNAGLNSVFLQFDGTKDKIYQKTRGRSLLEEKIAAIDNCAKEGLGIVLVPTLVPGVNMDNLGEIIDFAISRMPSIRGVHFQPISYFGRYPDSPSENRVTIPEILRNIETQTSGKIKVDNFLPAGAENSYCSFHGNFILMEDKSLKPWSSFSEYKTSTKYLDAKIAIKKSRSFVARQWSAPKKTSCCNTEQKVPGLDEFLERVKEYTLCISGMAFQDVWTVDLERLKDCKLHVFSPQGRLIPFCAYNLTARNGESIYRRV